MAKRKLIVENRQPEGVGLPSRKETRSTASRTGAVQADELQAEDDHSDVVATPPSKRRRIKAEPKSASKKSPKPIQSTDAENKEESIGEGHIVATPTKPKVIRQSKSAAKLARQSKGEIKEEPDDVGEAVTEKVVKKRKIKQEPVQSQSNSTVEGGVEEQKVRKKRKTKEEKEAEAMPLAARTVGHKLYVGAHVSASGGVHKAVPNSVRIGGNAFALFLKSQRKWSNPALTDDVATSFHSACKEHSYSPTTHIVPHGSYLVNLAHTDKERIAQAYESFLDDIQRCERLGITLYNFHPGNTAGKDRATAIKQIASSLNKAHMATKNVVTLLENMAAAGGNVIGTTFEDLRDIISYVEDKTRVGVCFDTCHAFAAGYDLRSPQAYEKTMQDFTDIVGMKYLRALHINDSKAPLGARRDLHANIGTGFLGLRAFHNIANDIRLAGLPLVLETPISVTDGDGQPLKDEKGHEKSDAGIWAREIKLIESLTDMDASSAEFMELEKSLARKGAGERKRVADQAERRKEKEAKLAAKGKAKKGTAQSSETSDLSELEDA